MGRRGVIAVFAFLAVMITVAAGKAFASAVGGHDMRPWLDFAFAAIKAGVTVAFAIFVVRRGPARRRVWGLLPFAACTAATLSVALLQRPSASTGDAVVIAGEAFALIAGAWMLGSTLALGRCFGVLPEARGLVTHGPYRLVRHPLYLGELSLCAGLVIAAPSVWNLVLAVVFVTGQTLRMGMEERELSAQFPEYRAYARRTRRLIPIPRHVLYAEDGQALVEYAFITSIVSIVAVIALGLIGQAVNLDLTQVVGGF